MAEDSYIMQLLAGLFYIGVSIPLFRLASRSGQPPERILGWTFLWYGISYCWFNLPAIPAFEAHLDALYFIGRITTSIGVGALIVFTWRVFRPGVAWAAWFAGISIALMALGLGISAWERDWTGLDPLHNVGFWLEWLGETLPAAWVAGEGANSYLGARKRVRFGLCDDMVANRFMLWCLFGLSQLVSMSIYLIMNIEYMTLGHISEWSDQALGLCEISTASFVWLAFFPPKIYRSFVSNVAGAAKSQGS